MTKKKRADEEDIKLSEDENNSEEVCDECDCEECQEACDCEEHDEQDECHCHECHCQEKENQAAEYLAIAQRLQADFENYRKHVTEQLERERQEGIKSVIEVFLPCLDSFKEAKKSVTDETVLAGINMIEDKILSALETLQVERIKSVGEKFDAHLHNVIAAMNNPEADDDIILDEYQSGWKMNGKVIRYAKVIVNKKS